MLFTTIFRFNILILLVFLTTLLHSSPSWSNTDILIVQNQDSQPKYFLDGRKNKGLCGDIYIELQARLRAKGITVFIPGTYTPIKRIMQKLSAGSAHVYCGAGRNAEREKKVHYSSVPLYSVSHVVMSHRDEKSAPASFDDLAASNTTIGVLFGTATARFLKEQDDLKVNESFYDLDQAFQLISVKKLKYFYYHDLALDYFEKYSPLPLKVLPNKFRTYSHWMIYSKHIPKKLRKIIDQEVTKIVESGVIDLLRAKYRP